MMLYQADQVPRIDEADHQSHQSHHNHHQTEAQSEATGLSYDSEVKKWQRRIYL